MRIFCGAVIAIVSFVLSIPIAPAYAYSEGTYYAQGTYYSQPYYQSYYESYYQAAYHSDTTSGRVIRLRGKIRLQGRVRFLYEWHQSPSISFGPPPIHAIAMTIDKTLILLRS